MTNRKRLDNNGDPLGGVQRSPKNGGVKIGQEHSAHVEVTSSTEQAFQLANDLIELCQRGDGWLRITSDRDGKIVYVKYKLNGTRWPNHYVFYSSPIYDIALAVAGIVRMLARVDAGTQTPTPDKPFNHM